MEAKNTTSSIGSEYVGEKNQVRVSQVMETSEGPCLLRCSAGRGAPRRPQRAAFVLRAPGEECRPGGAKTRTLSHAPAGQERQPLLGGFRLFYLLTP